jgi:small subunit ribosomal protein S3e
LYFVLFRQGVLGIKVKIMLPWDPNGKMGPKKPLPDHVGVVEPKEDNVPKDNAPSAPAGGAVPSVTPPSAVGLEGVSELGPALGKSY